MLLLETIQISGIKIFTGKEFDLAIQKTLEYVLPQRSKQSIKWTTKVTNINININCYKVREFLWNNVLVKMFFSSDMVKRGSSRPYMFWKFARRPKLNLNPFIQSLPPKKHQENWLEKGDVFCCGAWGNGVIRVQETITTIYKEPRIGNISK